ncbi:hypothetical protein GCM10020000_71740 [Streptomyces olivoverticillatus]
MYTDVPGCRLNVRTASDSSRSRSPAAEAGTQPEAHWAMASGSRTTHALRPPIPAAALATQLR